MSELDLHSYTVEEAMVVFLKFYNENFERLKEFKLIHGYGSSGKGGKIKKKIRTYLDQNKDKLTYETGEGIDLNQGYVLIFPKTKLPTLLNELEKLILSYCDIPRGEEKIIGKFRRFGMPKVKLAISKLKKEKSLEQILKGKVKCYKSIKGEYDV